MNAKYELFCREYMRNGCDHTKAYITVYNATNLKMASNNASRLMRNQAVAQRIADLRGEIAKELMMTPETVLAAWVDLWHADPSELVSVRALSCRYCYGKGHNYQYLHPREWTNTLAAWLDRGGIPEKKPINKGGFGYNPTIAPHPECPECFGEGTIDLKITPTDKLSKRGKRLFAGAEYTKHGIKITMHDQAAALLNLAKALGLMVDRSKEVTPEEDPVAFLKELASKLPN